MHSFGGLDLSREGRFVDVIENSSVPFHKEHKLALQSLAFGIMMLVPVGLYLAAKAGSGIDVLVMLVALGCGVLLAAWVG